MKSLIVVSIPHTRFWPIKSIETISCVHNKTAFIIRTNHVMFIIFVLTVKKEKVHALFLQCLQSWWLFVSFGKFVRSLHSKSSLLFCRKYIAQFVLFPPPNYFSLSTYSGCLILTPMLSQQLPRPSVHHPPLSGLNFTDARLRRGYLELDRNSSQIWSGGREMLLTLRNHIIVKENHIPPVFGGQIDRQQSHIAGV